MNDTLIEIPARGVRSLSWDCGTLVDWVGRGRRFRLDGTESPGRWDLGYHFDTVVFSPSGRFRVAYERLGALACLSGYEGTGDGARRCPQFCRDIDHAEVFEFPIALFTLSDGREVMAHCPNQYNRIEIDDLVTGQRLTARSPEGQVDYGAAPDFYHSRLATNPSGTKLMSAGWVWHPIDSIMIYDIPTALSDPTSLDRDPEVGLHYSDDVSSAAFCGDDLVVLSTTEIRSGDWHKSETRRELLAEPKTIALCDVNDGHCVTLAPLEEPAGTLMVLNKDYVIGFYRHPKVIHVPTGRVVHRWPDLYTGTQNSSILGWDAVLPPPLAMDAPNSRFAVADSEKITVVMLSDIESG